MKSSRIELSLIVNDRRDIYTYDHELDQMGELINVETSRTHIGLSESKTMYHVDTCTVITLDNAVNDKPYGDGKYYFKIFIYGKPQNEFAEWLRDRAENS